MLWLKKTSGEMENRQFLDLPQILPPHCLIVVNNSKVIPARLQGQRASGGKLEMLLLKEVKTNTWDCKVKNSSRLKIGEQISLAGGELQATLLEKTEEGTCHLEFSGAENLMEKLEAYGHPPLPPYILAAREKLGNREQDLTNYQTHFAGPYGAVAAPTAGLHFTQTTYDALQAAGHEFVEVTLHVGLGTFEPIRVEDVETHQMHSEEFEISPEAAAKINQAKAEGRPILAVGTTSLRALEGSAKNGQVQPGRRSTEIFIYPPYEFQIPNLLLTNFHLPESTLMMLVAAFCSTDQLMNAYAHAIEEKYRFYSFGDCMLIS